MKKLPFFLALRYLFGNTSERNISWMVRICFISILVGSSALALVMCIMDGFQKETCKKLQGMNAQISIEACGQPLNWKAIKKVLKKEFPEVAAAAPSCSNHIIIQSKNSQEPINLALLCAISPELQKDVTNIESTLIKRSSPTNLSTCIDNKPSIIMGQPLAQSLGIKENDTIELLFIQDEQTSRKKITLDQTKARIGGVFKTGIEDFDYRVIYCSFSFMKQIFPDSHITRIDIKLNNNADETTTINALKKRFGLNIYSWQSLYPALVSALKLEKYAMFFILSLIILVASMNIMSLLFMQIVQKKGDIAILKALGMPNKSVQSIFIIMGMIIACCATTAGLSLALCMCLFLKKYPFITLPDAYYVSHLPVSIQFASFAYTFAAIIIICLLTTWIASKKATQINIASVLRFDT